MIRCYYIFVTPPLNSYRTRYGMDYLRSKGCDVQVIDVSPIVNPAAYLEVTTGIIEERIVINSKQKYRRYMKKTPDNAVFFITTDFVFSSYFIHKAIRKGQKYGYLSRINSEVEPPEKPLHTKIIGLLKDFSVKHCIESLFIRIPRKWLHLQAADFMILGGSKNRELYLHISYVDKHTLVKHIHSADYEACIQALKRNDTLVEERSCVFIDDYIPYHPDNLSDGFFVDPEEYYQEIEQFFEFIEKKYDVKVVIAEHPRADYGNHPNVLKKYQKFRFKSAELVKNAEFVIAHFSSGVSMAAVFRKPLILIITSGISKYPLWVDATTQISEILGCDIYNISQEGYEADFPEKLEIDNEKYTNYVIEYQCIDKTPIGGGN